MAGGKKLGKGKKAVETSSSSKMNFSALKGERINDMQLQFTSSASEFAQICPPGKKEIVVDDIPGSHRFKIYLDDNELAYYGFDNVVFGMRSLISYGGVDFSGVPVAFASSDNFAHVTFFFGEYTTNAILKLSTVYVIAVTVDGIWCFPKESSKESSSQKSSPNYWIKDSRETAVKHNYPTTFKFKVGIEVLRNAVSALNSHNVSIFGDYYHAFAVNISESIRLVDIHVLIRGLSNNDGEPIIELDEMVVWSIKNWAAVSKQLRLSAKSKRWDPRICLDNAPEEILVKLANFSEALAGFGVLCGTEIEEEESVDQVQKKSGTRSGAVKNKLRQ